MPSARRSTPQKIDDVTASVKLFKKQRLISWREQKIDGVKVHLFFQHFQSFNDITFLALIQVI